MLIYGKFFGKDGIWQTAIPHLLPILLKSSLKIPDLIDDCGNQFHISQNIFKK
jgi:hypothetical protein